jgi:hypothetical protein
MSSGERGRWQQLFADLEAAAEAGDHADFVAEVADRTRSEAGRLRLTDRLRAVIGHQMTLELHGGQSVTAVLREVGPDWVLLAEPPARELLVPLAAVCVVRGLGALSSHPGSEGAVAARLDLRYALRRLARDRAAVVVVLAGGGTLHGTCDRVGVDFLELAEHAHGEPRRMAAVRRVSAVPVGGIVLVRSA